MTEDVQYTVTLTEESEAERWAEHGGQRGYLEYLLRLATENVARLSEALADGRHPPEELHKMRLGLGYGQHALRIVTKELADLPPDP